MQLDINVLSIFVSLSFIVLLIFFLWYKVRHYKKRLDEQKSDYESKIKVENDKVIDLISDVSNKSRLIDELKVKYGKIIDVEDYAKELLQSANTEVERLKNQATENKIKSENMLDNAKSRSKSILSDAESARYSIISEARSEAASITSGAKEKLKELQEKSDKVVSDARLEAGRIVNFAQEQAKEIAGSAYEAKAKAESYETAIIAMKNTISGYKDDYIVPNHSVLDDLADEFSFKEAGDELKKARERVRNMIKDNLAGQCDYVENNRKMFAIHFAVDAFNGKVDSALSKVKHDNYGRIKQEILDAFALVNFNGAPFKNARITPEFLEARLIELKWAVAAHELRKIEKEEQAAIKAQIREEERVLKEIEKARKEAEKEEKILQKALEKARSELAVANEEQRAEYEHQLAELESKLKEAEEKGQRAISMAQQTRRGHVYVISNIGSFGENVFKIGMTRRLEPMDRVRELGDASVPFSFDVHAMVYSEDAPALEKELHRHFHLQTINKVNPRKEFFKTSLMEVRKVIEHAGLTEVHWTMKAEASEYRESLAIEKEQMSEAVA